MINKKTDSFTLIEILVVIVVIGILSSFIFVGLNSISGSATTAKTQAWANSLKNAGLLSIVSEYKFEGPNNSGNANTDHVKDSWGANHGAVPTPPTVLTGSCALGKCLSFSGSQFVTITDSTTLNLGTKMSAFIWVKGATQTDDGGIFGQYEVTTANQKCWIIATTTTALKVTLADSTGASASKTYTSAQSIFDSKWHYVGFTYTVNTLKLFIDGQDVTSAATKSPDTAMTTLSNPGAHASIGSYLTTANAIYNGFNGQLDDAIIFSEAISISEVQRQYFSGLNSLLAKGEITNEEYNQRISVLSDSLGSK